MAVKYPQELLDDALMARSVMDEPRSGFQKVTDVLFGRTPQDRLAGTAGVGQIFVHPAQMATVKAALARLPERVKDFLLRTPTRIRVGPMTEEAAQLLSPHFTPAQSGYAATPTSAARFTRRLSPFAKIPPAWVDIRAGENLGIPNVAHELGHAAMSAAGREARGLSGVRATPRALLLRRGYNYPSRTSPEETAADYLANITNRAQPFDVQMVERELKRLFPRLTNPPVLKEVSEGWADTPLRMTLP